MTRSGGRSWRVLAALAGLVLAATACGGGAQETQPAAAGGDGEDAAAASSQQCGELDPDVTLNVINAGGEESDAITAGYIEPFTERTGIEVRLDPPNDMGRLQAMVESGQITHDLFTTESTTLQYAKAEDLLEPIDYEQMDLAPSLEEGIDEYALGFQYYSTIMGWRPDAVSDEGPQTWAEFFDTEKYPGRRALADYPDFTLPIALLADGVSPEELYPLDIDRGFAFLDRVKDDVVVWWEAGAQPPQLLADQEVDFSMVWSGRIVSQADELGLDYTFQQGLLDLAFIGIPKGAPNYCEALAFLEEVSKPENQAAAAEVLPYTGPAEGIDEFLPQDRLEWFPTSEVNYDEQVLQDATWWFENGEDVQQRWEEFKLSR